MLLPHGYEGQGPEHSSARLERYLQLCAENNLQVCYPTTPAQIFHLLRRQVHQEVIRPLIVMTPKSLLRLPAATSTISDLTSGGFLPVIDDASVNDADSVERIILCSGKLFYDLDDARQERENKNAAVVRVEQLYPFPADALEAIFKKYGNAKYIVWAQEEPKNMGAWTFVEPRLDQYKPNSMNVIYAARYPSASPATGSYAIHGLEQQKLIKEAFELV